MTPIGKLNAMRLMENNIAFDNFKEGEEYIIDLIRKDIEKDEEGSNKKCDTLTKVSDVLNKEDTQGHDILKCSACGYETKYGDEVFVGIFNSGSAFSTTDKRICGLYGCPKCGTVIFTKNLEYIRKRKAEYKNANKSK